MTWTYSGDPTSSARDQLRYRIGDTDQSSPLLSDEELDFELAEVSGSVARAAPSAAEEILSRFARQVDKSVGDLRISASQRHAQYARTVAKLKKSLRRGAAPWAGGISVSDKESRAADTDSVEPAFSRDLHSFPPDPATGENQLEDEA